MSTQTQTPSAMNSANTFAIGSIAENFFTVGGRESIIVVKVLGEAPHGMLRVADVRDCAFGVTAHELIQGDKTWAVPVANLRSNDADCTWCHKNGLVAIG
jgi:hypothetical protein